MLKCADEGPIRFRDGFSGGRTGPMKIYHCVKPGEKISYKDVRSSIPKQIILQAILLDILGQSVSNIQSSL